MQGANNWDQQPVDVAARLHEAYTTSVPDRIARFGMHMDESGLPLSQFDWTSLDAFDDLWHWAQDHLSMFDDRRARLTPDPALWYPYIPNTEIPADWPSWSGHPDLSLEAHEFSSGMAALLARHAIEHWGARWVFGDTAIDPSTRNQSLLEIPRPFEHRAAKFGPVRFSPEQAIAGSVHNFYRHPLWHAQPVWHTLYARTHDVYSDWSVLSEAEAERFHDDYVGGHIRRLSEFREWLQRRGLDTTAMAFDRATDLDYIWAWAQSNVTFAEQVTIPRSEFRSWYPQLAQGAQPSPDLPRWSTNNLSAETLDFTSGLAACAVEVALRSWGADWTIGGRRGVARSTNRTHLKIQPVDGRGRPVWLNIELDVATWLGRAIVSTKRRTPRQPMWRNVLGESNLLGQFSAMYEVPSAPWTAWRARFEPRLLPEAITPPPPLPTADPLPVEAVPVIDSIQPTAPTAAADPFAGNPPATPAPEPFIDRVESTPPDPLMTPPPAVPVPSEAGPALDAGFSDGLDVRVEPDDLQGDRFWIIEIDTQAATSEPSLVDRFASRLNRSRGVASAARTGDELVSLRMNRFGASDIEAVETLVFRIWEQAKTTHRSPALT